MNTQERLHEQVSRHPFPLLFMTISGAHLYGFPSPDSDYDLRGVHVLPPREVVGLMPGRETIELSEMRDGLQIDLVTHDAKKFFLLLLKKNGYVLEQLYSPLVVHTTPEHDELKAIAAGCITRHHSHHYRGFSANQWRLFEKESPRRVKPLLYVYRVLLTGIHLMRTGRVEANLVHLNEEFKLPYLPELIARKVGGHEAATLADEDLEFHRREYERLRAELEDAASRSQLPEAPTVKPELHELLLRLRLQERTEGRRIFTPEFVASLDVEPTRSLSRHSYVRKLTLDATLVANREKLEGILARYPEEKREVMLNRIRSFDDTQSIPHIFELYVYDRLLTAFDQVEVEPEIECLGPRRPDFLVDGRIAIEACTLLNNFDNKVDHKAYNKPPQNPDRNTSMLNMLRHKIHKYRPLAKEGYGIIFLVFDANRWFDKGDFHEVCFGRTEKEIDPATGQHKLKIVKTALWHPRKNSSATAVIVRNSATEDEYFMFLNPDASFDLVPYKDRLNRAFPNRYWR